MKPVPGKASKHDEPGEEPGEQPDPASKPPAVGAQARRLHLPLKSSTLVDCVVAQARVALHHALLLALKSNWSVGWGRSLETPTVAFEEALANYAGAILKDLAAQVRAYDAVECLTKLRSEITEGIVRWILPGEEYFQEEDRSLRDSDLLTLDGEWEERLEESYRIFRAERPVGNLSEADATDFRITFVYRLRYQCYRMPFEKRLRGALQGALIEAEPQIRAQFPEKIEVPQRASQRRRGFPARAEEHRLVLAALEPYGEDWPEHLVEICRRMPEDLKPPKGWKKQHALSSWESVAEELEGGNRALQKLVREYLSYRIRWDSANR